LNVSEEYFLPENFGAGSSQILAESFQTTRRPIVEDNYLHCYSRQNLKYLS